MAAIGFEDEDTDDKEDDSDDESGKNNFILKESYVAVTTICFTVGVTKARLSQLEQLM